MHQVVERARAKFICEPCWSGGDDEDLGPLGTAEQDGRRDHRKHIRTTMFAVDACVNVRYGITTSLTEA